MNNFTGGFTRRPRPVIRNHKMFLIEGEMVSINDISMRLGVDRATAAGRFSRVRDLPGAVTWEKLSKAGKTRNR